MNSILESDELIDIRKTYSEGNVDLFNTSNAVKIVSRDIESLNLNTDKKMSSNPKKTQVYPLILILLDDVKRLHRTITSLQNDIRMLATHQVYYEDQNAILTRQLNRKRDDIKKLNMELITSEHNLEHYRQLINKYSVSDASSIEHLTTTNRDLQEELLLQQKKNYTLEQQLYLITRENDRLRSRNKSLYDVVDQRHYQTIKSKKQKPLKKSWWSRVKLIFRRKKRPVVLEPARIPRFSSSVTDESVLSSVSSRTSGYPTLKEDVFMLRRASTHSHQSEDKGRIPISNSITNLPLIADSSIQKRVRKQNKKKTKSEQITSRNSSDYDMVATGHLSNSDDLTDGIVVWIV